MPLGCQPPSPPPPSHAPSSPTSAAPHLPPPRPCRAPIPHPPPSPHLGTAYAIHLPPICMSRQRIQHQPGHISRSPDSPSRWCPPSASASSIWPAATICAIILHPAMGDTSPAHTSSTRPGSSIRAGASDYLASSICPCRRDEAPHQRTRSPRPMLTL
ncbi:hypothetical protein BS78_04G119000 [Paspalum vaginatum]|nr:hypothetical protein BS78_04G119000 [Paspalum vaginatum]